MENNNENLNDQVNENNMQPEINNQPIVNDNVETPSLEPQTQVHNDTVVTNDDVQLIPSKKNNNILVIILVLIIIGVAGYFAYTKFIAKEEPKGSDNPTPTPVVTVTPTSTAVISSDSLITELTKSELSNSNKEFKLSNTTINLKKENGKLYINNSIATIQNYNGEFVEIEPSAIYKTNKYIIISVEWQSTEYPYAINENGELINIKRMTADTGQDYIHDLKLENNKVVATQSGDGPGSVDEKVEFEYKINEMSIKYAK